MGAPEPFEFLLLKDTKQLGLKFNRKLANFIQKERAPVSSLKAAYPLSDCSSEGASLMSEKLAFQEISRDSRTIDRHKTVLTARAGIMNRACDYFLAGAGLASDQDGTVHGRYHFYIVKNSP